VLGADNRAAEASKGKGMERGCPPPQPTIGGPGERRKLPQRFPGWCPGRKRVLVYLELEKHTL